VIIRRPLALATLIVSLLLPAGPTGAAPATARREKKEAAASAIEKQRPKLTALSDQIWRFAETALKETRSAKVLADFAEAQGFRVERGVAGMPTAFVAAYGSGRPIIGILGEYDALPGISQKAQPSKEPLEAGAAGHGCGHNLFGVASLGASIAVKDLIGSGALKGTVRFYGTPAEEAVGGKLYMARAGLFNDLDVALAWHPGDKVEADTQSSLAMVDVIVDFKGKAAHAAYDPWNGRSALDGLEILTHAINLMREHVRPSVRLHYAITKGGDVPNVVPEEARLWCWVRDVEHPSVEALLERLRTMADGAALAAGVEAKLTVQNGVYEMLINMAGARLLHRNLTWLGPLKFSPEEQEFAIAIQKATGVPPKGLSGQVEPLDETPGPPERGSTDVADISWLVPTLNLTVTTAPDDAPWHAWPVVASGGMSIGHKGMLYAAKALAATMVDLFDDPGERQAIRKEFEDRTRGQTHTFYIPDGPPPLPN
jgi:aminobenzoyl-glutamate utilization protein B